MRVIGIAATVLAAVIAAGGAAGADPPSPLPIYPQAGIIGKDLFVTNHVDLDPGPGLRDFACGTQTYDGHTGQDSIIRSFREMDIGVPVFAALDGEVISTQDGFYDREFGTTLSRFDNHIVIQHGPGRFTIYGHLRRGLTLRRGDKVLAGQQIGWTASSGSSTWPHLHFTAKGNDEVEEPFAGACRPGESGWVTQPVFPTEPYARDLAVSAKPFRGRGLLPHDKAVRTGTFVRGTRTVYLRLELGAVSPGQQLRVRLYRPDGSTAVADQRPIPFAVWHGYGHGYLAYRVAFSTVGAWPVTVTVADRQVVDTTLRVVPTTREVRNRRPNAFGATLIPPEPTVNDVLQCRVETSLVNEDPDYDIVRYRYRWAVGGRAVRTVTSAAHSDVLRHGIASPGVEVRCSVTPSDGRLSGAPVTAVGTIRS
jgi:murein DD-endopeptidase MepM/ murein hydrolase activator NlpD